MQRAGEAVAAAAANAHAGLHVDGVSAHSAGRVEGMVAGLGEIVGQLLDARLVLQRRERVRGARRRIGGILAAVSVHLVQPLGLGVVGLHLLVADRPGGRDPVVMLDLAEVLGPEAVQGRTVQLGGAADEVVHLRLEALAVVAVPGVGRDVAAVDEHVVGIPVLRLAGEPVAALQQQDALAGGRQLAGQRATARAGTDDDHVVAIHAHSSSSSSARMIRAAASISARCEKACGKLPRCLPVSASNSSAYSPSGEAIRSSRSIRS